MKKSSEGFESAIGAASSFLFGEPIPLPEVVEEDSDACWALWEELTNHGELVRPHVLRGDSAPQALASQSMILVSRSEEEDADDQPPAFIDAAAVMALATRHNRVCPLPGPWLELYDLLTRGRRLLLRRHPPESMTGRAWTTTSSISKRLRMRDQIRWAADYGGLGALYAFLVKLPDDQWLHLGQ